MSRIRLECESEIYHVVTRGTGRQIIFEDDSDRKRFLRILKRELDDSEIELYAWCLMSNHVHLLLRGHLDTVSQAMQQILGMYARYFNGKTGHVGHLFQSRFWSEPVENDEQFLTVVRYIHRNPVKAGVAAVDNYRWSSFREYVGEARMTKTDLALSLSGGVDAFTRFNAMETDDKCLEGSQGRGRTYGMPEERALELARTTIAPLDVKDVKALDTSRRKKALVDLKAAGLTIRQIERLTGIGRNTIQRAK